MTKILNFVELYDHEIENNLCLLTYCHRLKDERDFISSSAVVAEIWSRERSEPILVSLATEGCGARD